MARFYQKRGVWYAWGYKANGERWIKTTRQRDRRTAVIVGRRIERAIVGAGDDAAHPTATLGEAVNAMLASQERGGRAPATIGGRS